MGKKKQLKNEIIIKIKIHPDGNISYSHEGDVSGMYDRAILKAGFFDTLFQITNMLNEIFKDLEKQGGN